MKILDVRKPEKNLLFVDSETTGLYPTKKKSTPYLGEMISLAGILTDPTGEKVISDFYWKLQPRHIETADPKALQVNGYNEKDWGPEDCKPREDAAKDLLTVAKDVILVGQNISFDISFMEVFLEELGLEPTWHYHKVDTMNLAWPFYVNRTIDYFNLDSLCTFCGTSRPAVHNAKADIEATRTVYLSLMKKYKFE